MTMNAGIVTEKLEETKSFYTNTFGWEVIYENDFYLLMKTPTGEQLSFGAGPVR